MTAWSAFWLRPTSRATPRVYEPSAASASRSALRPSSPTGFRKACGASRSSAEKSAMTRRPRTVGKPATHPSRRSADDGIRCRRLLDVDRGRQARSGAGGRQGRGPQHAPRQGGIRRGGSIGYLLPWTRCEARGRSSPLVVDTRADAAPSRPSDDPRHAPAAVLLIGRAQRFADPYPSPIGRRRTRSRPGSSTATHPSTRSFSRAFRLASSKATWRSGCRSAPRRKSTTEGRRSRRSEAACRSQYLPRPPLSSCAERANTSSSLAAPSP